MRIRDCVCLNEHYQTCCLSVCKWWVGSGKEGWLLAWSPLLASYYFVREERGVEKRGVRKRGQVGGSIASDAEKLAKPFAL